MFFVDTDGVYGLDDNVPMRGSDVIWIIYTAHSVSEHWMLFGEMPATYSREERAVMVFVHGFCNGNGRATVEYMRK